MIIRTATCSKLNMKPSWSWNNQGVQNAPPTRSIMSLDVVMQTFMRTNCQSDALMPEDLGEISHQKEMKIHDKKAVNDRQFFFKEYHPDVYSNTNMLWKDSSLYWLCSLSSGHSRWLFCLLLHHMWVHMGSRPRSPGLGIILLMKLNI